MVYSFDQPTRATSAGLTEGNGLFAFYDPNGDPHFGSPIAADTLGNVVVAFAAADPVSTAVRAFVPRGDPGTEGTPDQDGGVSENAGDPQTTNALLSVVVPGTSGQTARPDLVSAALVPGPSNQIDFTFNQPVVPALTNTGCAAQEVAVAAAARAPAPGSSTGACAFSAVASNGRDVQGEGVTVISPNTVRVTFPGYLQNMQELIVAASAYAGAVLSINPTRTNTSGGVPVGDNAGAFATGFTTGPDAFSVTFDNATGSVNVQMDQRVDPGSIPDPDNCTNHVAGPPPPPAGCFVLLANDGTIVTASPLSAAVVDNSPFTSQVRLTYNPSDLARASALLINGPPSTAEADAESQFEEPGEGPAVETYEEAEQGNIRQVISPTASAAAFQDPAKGNVRVRWTRVNTKQALKRLAKIKRLTKTKTKAKAKRHHRRRR
jgi:hypothetical protein